MNAKLDIYISYIHTAGTCGEICSTIEAFSESSYLCDLTFLHKTLQQILEDSSEIKSDRFRQSKVRGIDALSSCSILG